MNCLDIIKKWEGFRSDAYLDPVKIPTIGYGTIRYPNGQKVRLGDTITEAEAEVFLKYEVDEMVKLLEDTLKGTNLNQNQFDAIVSLCYNIGVGAFQRSTVLRKIQENPPDFKAAAEAFELWNKGTVGGVKVILAGLVNRRKDERALFESKDKGEPPMVEEESPLDIVTLLEGYRDGDDNVIVAWADKKVVEILVLKSPLKEDFITVLQQYKNAKGFQFAPPDKKIPSGDRTEVASKAQDIPKVENPPTLERKLLIFGVSDADPGVTGSDVKELQQRLMDLGYYEGEINGVFDRATDAAVKDFQTKVFGAAEADGKVGKITWGKLFGTTDGATATKTAVSTETFAKGSNFLRLTKTAQKDAHGLVKLKLEYFKDGKAVDSLLCISGQARAQFFRTGKDSKRGSFEPLPEGKWTISDMKWAAGKDVYNGNVWSGGLGPVKIFMDYVPIDGTRRANIEIHLDWNKNRFPGTAGCIGINTVADFKQLARWLRDTDPKELYVDWGLGTVKLPT